MRIYIAAPYTKGDLMLNIRAVIDAAEDLIAKGHTPYLPHLNALWHLVHPHPPEFWYAEDLKWLEVCDTLLRLPGESVGADAEVKHAKALGKPVYESAGRVPCVLNARKTSE